MKNRTLNNYINAAKNEEINFDKMQLQKELLMTKHLNKYFPYRIPLIASILVITIVAMSQVFHHKQELLAQSNRDLTPDSIYTVLMNSYERE